MQCKFCFFCSFSKPAVNNKFASICDEMPAVLVVVHKKAARQEEI